MDVEHNTTSMVADVDMQESSVNTAQVETTPINTETLVSETIVNVDANITDAVVSDVVVPEATVEHKMEDSDSDSDSDSSSEDEEEMQRKMYGFAKKTETTVVPKERPIINTPISYNADEIQQIPQIEKSELKPLGCIFKKIESLVIIRAEEPVQVEKPQIPEVLIPAALRRKLIIKPTDIPVRVYEGSVVFTEQGVAVGKVCDVFGPVQQPFYTIRYPNETVMQQVIGNCQRVCYSDTFAAFFDVNQIIQQSTKGYDDTEPGVTEKEEYSDDEDERRTYGYDVPILPELNSEEACMDPDLLMIKREMEGNSVIRPQQDRKKVKPKRVKGKRNQKRSEVASYAPRSPTRDENMETNPLIPLQSNPLIPAESNPFAVVSSDMAQFKESSNIIVEPGQTETKQEQVENSTNPFMQ